MSYLALVAAITVVPLLLGYRHGARIGTWCAGHGRAGALVAAAAALAWFGLAAAARGYADSDGLGWAWAEWFAQRGKWYVFAGPVLFMLGATFRSGIPGRARRAAALATQVLVIWLVVWRTMPSYVWLPRGHVRDSRGHIRQSIEQTCAPVCLGNMREVVCGRPAPTERKLARLSMTTVEGTPLRGLIAAAEALGLKVAACKVMSLAELQQMNAPAVVQISTIPSVRHATLLLRIHDDDLEFIDPAYGYHHLSPQRFEEIWYGKTAVFEACGR